jgi:hypothetical protein
MPRIWNLAALSALLAAGLALPPRALHSQPVATTETVCPEKDQLFLSAENFNGPDRTLFACIYKSPTAGSADVAEPLEVKGKCHLRRTDEITDMVSRDEPGKFSANIAKCRGDRLRCAVICNVE